MHKFRTWAVPGILVGLMQLPFLSPSFAQEELISDDLITGSSLTTPWQVCDTDSLAVDVTLLNTGGCAYRETPAEPGVAYRMSCGVFPVKFASVTLAFLDADHNTVATRSTEIFDDVAGAYSVELVSPANTAFAAIGIYGEPGSGFQDCVLIDTTPPPEPTKGSISGVSFFDVNNDSVLDSTDSRISGTVVTLFQNGSLIDQTTTNSSGEYLLGDLDVDACYAVTFGPADATLQFGQPGTDNDADANGITGDICLTEAVPDVEDIDIPFVAVPPVIPPADNAICGLAWVDINENGVFNDSSDDVLSNISVRLLNADSELVEETRTDDNGSYVFDSLLNGTYRVRFRTPDGHEPTIASGLPEPGTSYINANGGTTLITLPGDGNTPANSACTIQNVNGGFIQLPVAIEPTVANDDAVTFDVGVDFNIDVLANDAQCDAVQNVDLLGHNVPGQVVFDTQLQQFVVSNTTEFGVFSINYGLRGSCGSYDTADVRVELLEVIPPAPPAAPEAPVCRVETRGQAFNGGVDVFNTDEFGFAPSYNLYDRERNLVITLDSTDVTHKLLIGSDANENESPFIGSFEIEWNGANYGYDQVSIHFVSAVENNVESNLTECIRNAISPIALDLENNGRIARLLGDYQVDLDDDGIEEELTEWFAPSAGILVTADAEGKISGQHMFGNVPGVYADGFAELATLDTNKDGQLTGEELSKLAIWNDRNSDTIVDDGELSELANHQIVALATTHYKYMARATKANGKSILMEDVWLPMSPLTVSNK